MKYVLTISLFILSLQLKTFSQGFTKKEPITLSVIIDDEIEEPSILNLLNQFGLKDVKFKAINVYTLTRDKFKSNLRNKVNFSSKDLTIEYNYICQTDLCNRFTTLVSSLNNRENIRLIQFQENKSTCTSSLSNQTINLAKNDFTNVNSNIKKFRKESIKLKKQLNVIIYLAEMTEKYKLNSIIEPNKINFNTAEEIEIELKSQSDNMKYQWYKISESDKSFVKLKKETSSVFSPKDPGTFAVIVTDEFGCNDTSKNFNVTKRYDGPIKQLQFSKIKMDYKKPLIDINDIKNETIYTLYRNTSGYSPTKEFYLIFDSIPGADIFNVIITAEDGSALIEKEYSLDDVSFSKWASDLSDFEFMDNSSKYIFELTDITSKIPNGNYDNYFKLEVISKDTYRNKKQSSIFKIDFSRCP
jgi:hypothetical protein